MTYFYPISWPFSNAMHRLGFRLLVRVDVYEDEKAGVLIATSPDVRGLVVEADNFEQLKKEVDELTPILLQSKISSLTDTRANYHLKTNMAFA